LNVARIRTRWNGEFETSHEQQVLKKRLMLREAAAAFNERGFHNVSLDEVAVRLGISKTVFYYYFKDKNHLLLSCVEIGFELAEDAIGTAEKHEGNYLEKVVAFVHAYVTGITSEIGTCAVLTELTSLHADDLQAVRKRQRAFGRRLVRLVEQGRADGSIQVDNARAAVSWILSPPLTIPRLTQLWQIEGSVWLADHFAEFTRRSLTARAT
jgi:TetR/AcrR family transcriptional regulator